MQNALFEMNVQLSNVISDIVGETGLNILEAIIVSFPAAKDDADAFEVLNGGFRAE